jgi:hypothetical protein
VLEAGILCKILPQIPASSIASMILSSSKDLEGKDWSEEKRALMSVQAK